MLIMFENQSFVVVYTANRDVMESVPSTISTVPIQTTGYEYDWLKQ